MEPRLKAETLAIRKVDAVRKALDGRNPPWILSADTLIDVDRRVFGKAENRDEAKTMLQTLSGREHKVISALALFSGRSQKIDCRSNESTVRFAEFSEEEIDWYLDTGEWQGVAGAYRIQGIAACFISEIRGSYSSIVGLPLHDFYVMLKENGYAYSV
jgi:septum formation protein